MSQTGFFQILDCTGAVLWQSNNSAQNCGPAGGCNAYFQGDGNFVLYNQGRPYWGTSTGNSYGQWVFNLIEF